MDRVRRTGFPVVLRGYDRAAVDAYVAEVAQLVAELEATQLPENVVQRALDDIGDETSAILKRAHAAAEEIAARSRSQAEARIHHAEQEAELTRRDADQQLRALEQDAQAIWQERQRLIEDIRQLADDVLALADDAMERMSPPASRASDGAEDGAGPDEPVPGSDLDDTAAFPVSRTADAEPAADEDEPDTHEQPPGAEDEDTAERPPGS